MYDYNDDYDDNDNDYNDDNNDDVDNNNNNNNNNDNHHNTHYDNNLHMKNLKFIIKFHLLKFIFFYFALIFVTISLYFLNLLCYHICRCNVHI